PAKGLPMYPNGVIALDELKSSPVVLGYIVGGIESAMEDTASETGNVDTHASAYIFKVTLIPQ
ncbi:MAG: hypothetical protein V4492_05705, partial [Chlamydiota bacterium]